jgi:hypothetical protein
MTGIIQKSIHGIKAFVDPHDILFGRNAIATGGRDKPMVVLPGSPDTVVIWDDFIGDTGRPMRAGTDQYWRVLDGDTGSDTGSNVYVTPGTSGILRIKTGDTPIAKVKMGITGALQWKGNQGSIPTDTKNGLRMGIRLKAGNGTDTGGYNDFKDTGQSNTNIWVGFTDTIASETPVMDTGGVIISTATNAFGVGFGSRSGGDTGWVAYAVNGGTDATPVVLDTGVTAGIYDTIEMELTHGISDTGGTATFYINGQVAGRIAAPVAMNVALAPQVLLWGDSGGGNQMDVDWINISAPRDSGL